jgi:hypothetical protein
MLVHWAWPRSWQTQFSNRMRSIGRMRQSTLKLCATQMTRGSGAAEKCAVGTNRALILGKIGPHVNGPRSQPRAPFLAQKVFNIYREAGFLQLGSKPLLHFVNTLVEFDIDQTADVGRQF